MGPVASGSVGSSVSYRFFLRSSSRTSISFFIAAGRGSSYHCLSREIVSRLIGHTTLGLLAGRVGALVLYVRNVGCGASEHTRLIRSWAPKYRWLIDKSTSRLSFFHYDG